MATNPNMVAIQTVTVGSGGAATIAFSNIPQTYTDLKVVLSLRVSGSQSGGVNCYWAINGSSSNFTSRWLIGNGSTASSANRADAFTIEVNSAAQTASTFSNGEFYFPNYTSSNFKSYSLDNVVENNGTTANSNLLAGLYSSTSAITSLELVSGSGTFVQYSTATLYGVTSAGYGAKATGGIITQDANYFYHTFLSSGTFTPTQNLTCDYLVVAGGGGGGAYYGGGGGAGGLRSTVTATGGTGSLESPLSLTAQAYTVTVGAGGSGGVGASGAIATNGSDSVFSSITSTGGGRGGRGKAGAGAIGGSGGGGSSGGPSPAVAAGTTNQGFAGGLGSNETGNAWGYGGGGGGGAGGVGGSETTTTGTGNGVGGAGRAIAITGSSITYASGGGGCTSTAPAGGGGNGNVGAVAAVAGTNNTGGGGGAGGDGGLINGANGGSGIVIVRYAK